MHAEIVTGILKPDTVRDCLEEMVLKDIQDYGIEILWRKYYNFNCRDIQQIYSKLRAKKHFDCTTNAMTFGPSLVFLGRGDNAYEVCKLIKGNWDRGGIRAKYRIYSKEQLEEMGYSGDKLETKLSENRIHFTDCLRESAEMSLICMRPSEITALSSVAPCLYEEIKRITALTVPNVICPSKK